MRKALVTACWVLYATAALAEPTPQDQLQETQQRLEKEQQRDKELSERRAQLERELATAQKTLVEQAAAVQQNEKQLSDAEEKLEILTKQRKTQAAALAGTEAKLSSMMSAAVRLSQTPPEAVVMMPGDFSETLTAARVLSTLISSIRAESQAILEQMRELEALTEKVARTKERVADTNAALQKQYASMESRLKQRQALDAELSRKQESARKRLEELSREAENLQDLLQKLEASRDKAKRKQRSIADAKGKLRVPAAGKVKQRFAQTLGPNETSKGVLIATPAKASVVAPFDGEVVFTGPFLNYGKMVIVRHSDGYHSLLAGISRIDVTPGQFLLEGEPIGAMGDTSSVTDLYLEMRHNNQPIDPAPWISAL